MGGGGRVQQSEEYALERGVGVEAVVIGGAEEDLRDLGEAASGGPIGPG